MYFVFNLVLLTHLLGMAALVGGYLVALGRPAWNGAILWGARAQVLTGLIIVFMLELFDGLPEPEHMKIGVKLLIAIAVVAVVETGRRRTPVRTGLLHAAGGLALLNTALAVLW